MKNHAPLFIAILSTFSLSCFAQQNSGISLNAKMENGASMSGLMASNDLAVVSYHVEERINAAFGGTKTTYDVPSLSMVNTNDLGKNNTRIITPKYAKSKAKATIAVEQPKAAPVNEAPVEIKPVKVDIVAPKEKGVFAYIDVVGTYERVLDKGYKSADMLIKVGDSRFFEGNFVLAAKWYEQLIAIKPDLDPVYYYRYARSLIAISQFDKAREMMALFESKNL